MISYIREDMFRRNKTESVYVHACNAMGKWGAGVAFQFKSRFPFAYRTYNHWCEVHRHNVVGKCLLIVDGDFLIGCLVTSRGYGKKKDTEEKILKATYNSVYDLLLQMPAWKTIVSPKINNGLFGVSWEKTEQSIRQAIANSGQNIRWDVCVLDGKNQ